jgi:hypothetical protein
MMQLTVNGLTLSISNWQDKTGIDHRLIRWRMRAGWTPEQCIGLQERPFADRGKIKIKANGNLLSIKDWAAMTGIGHNTIYDRYVNNKWPAEEALGFKQRVSRRSPGPFSRTNNLTEFNGITVVTKTVEVLDSQEIGRQAMEVRKAAGLSRDQAAKALGWAPNTLYRLERGDQPWKQNVLDHFNEVARSWVTQCQPTA